MVNRIFLFGFSTNKQTEKIFFLARLYQSQRLKQLSGLSENHSFPVGGRAVLAETLSSSQDKEGFELALENFQPLELGSFRREVSTGSDLGGPSVCGLAWSWRPLCEVRAMANRLLFHGAEGTGLGLLRPL